jgi:hypothetical protein
MVIFWGALVGCADRVSPPPTLPRASAAEKQAAFQEVMACTRQQIAGVDDGVSDAPTIARALVAACEAQFRALGELGARSLSPRGRAVFLDEAKSLYRDVALQEVLAYRHWKQKQP